MKALILAAGKSKRMRKTAELTANKCLLELGGKAAVFYSLEYVSLGEIEEIIIVVNEDSSSSLINQVGNSYKDKKIAYVVQKNPKGVVHAIECSKQAIDGHDFILCLGDEILIQPQHTHMVAAFNALNLFAACGVVRVEDKRRIKKTYAVIQNKSATIKQLIEKPHEVPSNIMGTGNCLFSNQIFKYIDKTPVNPIRNERELPDLIQNAINDGLTVKSFNICQDYVNLNTLEDLTYARKLVESQKR